jgi:hypothetical protein
MAMWCEDTWHNLKKEESNDDEESWGFEGGYSSSRGRSRHSLDWQKDKLREKTLGHGEKSNMESEEEKEEDGDDFDGDYSKTPPLFAVAKVGGSDVKSASVVESLVKNTKKRTSNAPAVNSPTIATRGKGGQK